MTNINFNFDYDEFVKNTFVNALEGGCNYWYYLNKDSVKAIRAVVPKEENPYLAEAAFEAVWNKGATVPVFDTENETELLGMLSKDSVTKGITLAIQFHPSEYADQLNEEGDAWTADTLFQLFVMGEVIFG